MEKDSVRIGGVPPKPEKDRPRRAGAVPERSLGVADLWRLGVLGVVTMLAVTVAVIVSEHPMAMRHGIEIAAAEMRVQPRVEQAGRLEVQRLSAAVDVLNADRDRLYSRVTVVEHGLEDITGSISRRLPEPIWAQGVANVPSVLPSLSAKVASLVPVRSVPETVPAAIGTPTAAAGESPETTFIDGQKKSIETATLPAGETMETGEAVKPSSAPAPPMVLGLDLGGAKSVKAVRRIWTRAEAKHGTILKGLRPVIAIRERHAGAEMELRLIAGPLTDAAEVAQRCASLVAAGQACAKAAFDGQSLAAETPAASSLAPKRTNERSTHQASADGANAPVSIVPSPLPSPQRLRSVP